MIPNPLAYSYRVPYCVPYWSARTIGGIAKCILRGEVLEGPHFLKLKADLQSRYPKHHIKLCGSGRAAIGLALQASGVSEGDEVVVPAFCCASVLFPVLAVGGIPVFADVDNSLSLTPESIEGVLSHRTKAVIVAHLFGNPAPIDVIADRFRGRGLLVIDDAAQALGGTINGVPLGSFGDAGILSFGKGKVCFGTGGGVLLTKDAELFRKVENIRLEKEKVQEGVRDALSTLFWRKWRRWTLPLYVAWRKVARGMEEQGWYRLSEMRNIDAAVALSLIEDLLGNIGVRREKVSLYRSLLEDRTDLRLVRHTAGSACLTQPICLDPDRYRPDAIETILSEFRKRGFEIGSSFTPLSSIPEYKRYVRSSMSEKERGWKSIIELPCEPSVSKKSIESICSILSDVTIHCLLKSD